MTTLNMQSLKWIATAGIVIATICRALNLHVYDLAFGFVGTVLWAYCAWKSDDKPLFAVNAFCGIVLILGLFFG